MMNENNQKPVTEYSEKRLVESLKFFLRSHKVFNNIAEEDILIMNMLQEEYTRRGLPQEDLDLFVEKKLLVQELGNHLVDKVLLSEYTIALEFYGSLDKENRQKFKDALSIILTTQYKLVVEYLIDECGLELVKVLKEKLNQ